MASKRWNDLRAPLLRHPKPELSYHMSPMRFWKAVVVSNANRQHRSVMASKRRKDSSSSSITWRPTPEWFYPVRPDMIVELSGEKCNRVYHIIMALVLRGGHAPPVSRFQMRIVFVIRPRCDFSSHQRENFTDPHATAMPSEWPKGSQSTSVGIPNANHMVERTRSNV